MIILVISLGIIGVIFLIASFALRSHLRHQKAANVLQPREVALHTQFVKNFLWASIVLILVDAALYFIFLR